jgi:hypothetical protein
VPWLCCDPLQPGADGGEATEVEAPFVGDVGVGVECYVRYRVAVPDEEGAVSQVPLHHLESVVAEFSLRLERGARPLSSRDA